MIINSSGYVGIGISNPFAMLNIGNSTSISDGTLVIGNRNFKFGYDASINFVWVILVVVLVVILGIQVNLILIGTLEMLV
jgi:hypothetical protein